ncbi:MAG: anhydro-N-acetylmuramic acid kinase [Vulcanimicrobiaceae bacterium]
MIAAGLMSGTSLDGIDAVCVEIEPDGDAYRIRTLDFKTVPWEPALRARLLEALPPNRGTIAELARLNVDAGRALGLAARDVATTHRLDYVASHGQTIFHDGDAGVTLQIGDPFAIREAVLATVCYDFRSADCAAGGHGAPLVPYFDALVLRDRSEDRVAVNVGGIANVTLLPKGIASDAGVVAFDTGPGNMLLDAFVAARTGGAQCMDEDGRLAASGTPDAALLRRMMGDGYFARPAPKSTGRERFGTAFLDAHREALERLGPPDGAATLLEVTVESIASAIEASGFRKARILVSGGGARNPRLMDRLAARLPQARVETTEAMGVPVEAKEAIAFALLGYETLRGRAANVPAATGARAPVVLGAIAPYYLSALLERMERECRASS